MKGWRDGTLEEAGTGLHVSLVCRQWEIYSTGLCCSETHSCRGLVTLSESRNQECTSPLLKIPPEEV